MMILVLFDLHVICNRQNVYYFIKMRGIIQNACYFLFSTELNIFHIKDVYI